MAMRFDCLDDWLVWQESLNPHSIDLGLERVADVWSTLGRARLADKVVTVAGTNGKGSCVALLAAVLSAAGYRVGVYTSPHLRHYNERVCIDGQAVTDAALCQAFENVDQAREQTALTYFEFGTLAALDIFQRQALDVVLLEVGLGGRLDAVNVIDADVALITTIALDHVEWLGADRESIAEEKAGIFRHGCPAVCCDPQWPAALQREADRLGTELFCLGRDFNVQRQDDGCWSWQSAHDQYENLPAPALQGDFQYNNAAGVLMVLEQLPLACSPVAIQQGLQSVMLAGRFQVVPLLDGQFIVDVAHNVQAAEALMQTLSDSVSPGRVRVVIAMLADKDAGGVLSALAPVVDDWYLTGLVLPRGLKASQLAECLPVGIKPCMVNDDIVQVLQRVRQDAGNDDRIVVCGSFYTVSAALDWAADIDLAVGADA